MKAIQRKREHCAENKTVIYHYRHLKPACLFFDSNNHSTSQKVTYIKSNTI